MAALISTPSNLIPLLIILICFISSSEVSSLSSNGVDNLYGLFSTKTPYSYVENDNLTIIKPQEECKPIHINMVHRHGHRYPSSGSLKDYADLSQKINQGQKLDPDLNFTLPWFTPFSLQQKSHLTRVGESELYHLAKRIKTRFPDIFKDHDYLPWTYNFMSTNKERTIHSSNSLASGLFEESGSLANRSIQPISIVVSSKDPNDTLLRFYNACPNFVANIEGNDQVMAEFLKFQSGQTMQQVKDKVARKLNLTATGNTGDNELSYNELDAIYTSCSYELSMQKGSSMDSGICALLDEEDRRVLDYANDLGDFYQFSNPENSITFAIACPLVDNILTTVNDAAMAHRNKSGTIHGVFRSTHSKAVMMMFTLLGLNKQTEPLMHDTYPEMSVNRSLHGSYRVPFAANFYFVLYGCPENVLKIQLYWNEQLVKVPGCTSAEDCDLDDFFNYFKQIQTDCESTFEKLCDVSSSSASSSTVHLSSFLVGCFSSILYVISYFKFSF